MLGNRFASISVCFFACFTLLFLEGAAASSARSFPARSLPTRSLPSRYSQKRPPRSDFRDLIRAYVSHLTRNELSQVLQGSSAVDVAVTPDQLDLTKADT